MSNDKLHSCVEQVMEQGHDESTAYAICNAALNSAGQKLIEIVQAYAGQGGENSMTQNASQGALQAERRHFHAPDLALEVREDGDSPKIQGYAAVFEQMSENLGFFREKIAPGAFRRSITEDDIRALWNHNDAYVLGRNKSGTLVLREDDHGLYIEVDPPDTQWARDAMVSIKRGDVSQMSFGFIVRQDEWDETDPKEPIRTLKDVQLLEVSPVTFAAYPGTAVAARTLANMGIDVAQLNEAVSRASRGMATPADERAVADTIEALRQLLPQERNQGQGQEDADVAGRLERLERYVTLLEKEVQNIK